jgi:hypothetical protein
MIETNQPEESLAAPHPAVQTPPRGGRPRKYENNAAKQAAFRARQSKRAFQGLAGSPLATVRKSQGPESADSLPDKEWEKWKRLLKKYPDDQGRLRGEVSGGYNIHKLDLIDGARQVEAEIGGRRPRVGNGPDLDSSSDQDSGLKRRLPSPIRPRKRWGMSESELKVAVERLARSMFGESTTSEDGEKLICQICGTVLNFWWRDATAHLLEAHPEIVRDHCREFRNKK